MKIKSLLFAILIVYMITGWGQFPPPPGHPESTAIYADSSIIVGWATSCSINRGYVNFSDTLYEINGSNRVSYGLPEYALGKADNQVVSIGDGGQATVSFYPLAITNGPGFDFVVFENGFSDNFLELAFVEVSSDGEHYYRFPSVSLTQTDTQIGPFDTLDTKLIYNLAGKYRALYGTPFDLAEVVDMSEDEKSHVHFVRIVDVIGSIDPSLGSYDSQGHLINDPFPTPFASGGFDLDAVGIINSTLSLSDNEFPTLFYPNPASDGIFFPSSPSKITIFDATLKKIEEIHQPLHYMSLSHLQNGIYFLCINNRWHTLIIAR